MTSKEAIDKLEHLINSPVGREEIDETCFEVMKYLAAQEPRVMTLVEYEAWIDTPFTERNPVFHEERTKRGIVACWANTVVLGF